MWDDYHFDGVIDDVRIYNYALDISAIQVVIEGGQAENSRPFDSEENVPQRATLSWVSGAASISHDVYFGTGYNAVANADTTSAEYIGRQTETFYVPFLDTNTTYFWRIDQILCVPPPPPPPPPTSGDIASAASANCIIPGNVWSFATGRNAGTITREVWGGISGNPVINLTNHPLYPDSPDIREEITKFEGPIDWANNYGTRIHGFLTPFETGIYTFWIASDDQSELWLSSNYDPVNQFKIAQVTGWTDPHQWDDDPEQKSGAYMLMAGQAYYIKALHKEGSGGDNIAVAWQGPGMARRVISRLYLWPYDTDVPTPDPMGWATEPHPTGSRSVSMTATPALDRSGVEYYFACISGGGHDSGWQKSTTYEDTGLEPNTVYTYTVTARDEHPNRNTTVPSERYSARTFFAGDFEPDGDVDFDDYARFTLHWPGAAAAQSQSVSEADLDGDGDVDFGDLAILVGDWLGDVEQPLPFPGRADNPNPPNGAIGVFQTADLSWSAGSNTISHDVYFGTTYPPAFQSNQTSTAFDPGKMPALVTHYWRIDEINQSGKTVGVDWSFTTRLDPPPPPP
jgi:hypothetical protein